MAEVLITLGIIGVVAALTIPALIGNYEKVVTVNRLKKAYSLFQQSINMAYVKYGIESFTVHCTFNPHYSCGSISTDYNLLIEALEPQDCNAKDFDNYITTIKKELNGYTYNAEKKYCHVLKDGTVFFFTGSTYIVDTNGIKKPNKFGRDLFVYFYVSSYFSTSNEPSDGYGFSAGYPLGEYEYRSGMKPGLYPSGYTNVPSVWNKCDKGTGNCTFKIMEDGWQIKDDYPW